MCPGRVHWRDDFTCCNQNIIQSKMKSLKWLESDFTEVTLTDDALHHPADISEHCVKHESLFFASNCHWDAFFSRTVNREHIFQPSQSSVYSTPLKAPFLPEQRKDSLFQQIWAADTVILGGMNFLLSIIKVINKSVTQALNLSL